MYTNTHVLHIDITKTHRLEINNLFNQSTVHYTCIFVHLLIRLTNDLMACREARKIINVISKCALKLKTIAKINTFKHHKIILRIIFIQQATPSRNSFSLFTYALKSLIWNQSQTENVFRLMGDNTFIIHFVFTAFIRQWENFMFLPYRLAN